MNKRIRFFAAALALFMALTLGLCGCTPNTESKEESAPARKGVSTYGAGENLAPDGAPFETVYVPGIFGFDRNLSAATQFKNSHNGLYAFDQMNNTVYEFDTEGHCLTETYWEAGDQIVADGSVWRLEGQENKGDPNDRHTDYRVLHFQDGQEIETLTFRTEQGTADLVATVDFFLILKSYWDENNNLHFTLESYNSEGTLQFSQELNEWMDVHLTDRGVCFVGRDSNSLFLYDPSNYTLTSMEQIEANYSICGFYGETVYLTDGTYLYRHKLGQGESEPLFRFDSLSLSGQYAPIPIGGTDSFFFWDITNDASPYRIAYPIDKNSLPAEQITLTLAINEKTEEFNQYGSYRDAILDFNTVNRAYKIVVRNYAESSDPFLALTADMAGGNAPDLIDVRGFGSAICSAATAEDLLPYVERDLGTDAFLPGPLTAMKTGGKLLSLMPSFSLTAILGPASVIDGQSINSFADLSSLAGGAEHVFYNSVDRETFLKWVFANNQRDYSAQQIMDMLRFASALPNEAVQNPYDLSEVELQESIERGEVMPLDYRPIYEGLQQFELARIADPYGMAEMDGACRIPEAEGIFGERISAIGLPCAGGNGIFLTPNQELMMPQASQHKDGAWEFLKFVLSDRYLINTLYSSWGFSHGIPITHSGYENAIGGYWEHMNGIVEGQINGVDFKLNYDPENCKALFLSLLDSVDGICRDGDEVFEAVMNTANSYFAGNKPLEQAADDIAKRLKIYNAEWG